MAANDEYPRGWTFTIETVGPGAAASITLPAVSGVTHVLESVHAQILTVVATGVAIGVNVDLGTGAVQYGAIQTSGTVPDSERFDQDIDLPGAIGAAITVALATAPVANEVQYLTIRGHDI